MGSHCYPAEVTFPPVLQPKLVLDLATPEGCKAELTCITLSHREFQARVRGIVMSRYARLDACIVDDIYFFLTATDTAHGLF